MINCKQQLSAQQEHLVSMQQAQHPQRSPHLSKPFVHHLDLCPFTATYPHFLPENPPAPALLMPEMKQYYLLVALQKDGVICLFKQPFDARAPIGTVQHDKKPLSTSGQSPPPHVCSAIPTTCPGKLELKKNSQRDRMHFCRVKRGENLL